LECLALANSQGTLADALQMGAKQAYPSMRWGRHTIRLQMMLIGIVMMH